MEKDIKLVNIDAAEVRRMAGISIKNTVETAKDYDKTVPEEKRQLEKILKYISSLGDAEGELMAIFPDVARSITQNFPTLQTITMGASPAEAILLITKEVERVSSAFVTEKLSKSGVFSVNSAKWLLFYDFCHYCYRDMMERVCKASVVSKEEFESVINSQEAGKMIFLSESPDKAASNPALDPLRKHINGVIDKKCGNKFFDKIPVAEVKELVTTSVQEFQKKTGAEIDEALIEIMIFEKLDTILSEYKKSMQELLIETNGDLNKVQSLDHGKITKIGDRVFKEASGRVSEPTYTLLSAIALRLVGKIVYYCR